MTTIEWKDDFVEGFVQEGLQRGIVKAKAEGVLKIIDARGINVTDKQREQVVSCADPAQLDQRFDRALTATTAAEIFQS